MSGLHRNWNIPDPNEHDLRPQSFSPEGGNKNTSPQITRPSDIEDSVILTPPEGDNQMETDPMENITPEGDKGNVKPQSHNHSVVVRDIKNVQSI